MQAMVNRLLTLFPNNSRHICYLLGWGTQVQFSLFKSIRLKPILIKNINYMEYNGDLFRHYIRNYWYGMWYEV